MFRASVVVAIFLVLVSCVVATGCLDNVIIPVFTNTGHTHLADNEGKLSVYFLDVGQGDSTLFVVDGKTILIDAGEVDMGDRVVSDLRKLGVTRIDLLVATHPHSDHIGGMQTVPAAFPVGQVLDAGHTFIRHRSMSIFSKRSTGKIFLTGWQSRGRQLMLTRLYGSSCSRHLRSGSVTTRT